MAKPVREYADGAVQPSHGGLCVVVRGGASSHRCHSRQTRRYGAQRCAGAGLRRHLAGRHRHRDAAPSGAAAAGAPASDHGHRGADERRHPCRAARATTCQRHGGRAARRFDSSGNDMIELSHRGGIAVVKMIHGKANALDIEFCEAIAAQFEALRGSDTRAVVLTGEGQMFSAGVNLIRLSEGGAAYVRRFLPALHRLYDTVFFFPKPVVAAVNGHAIAGGCVLECCADRRIAMAGGGRIGVTELLVGVPFPPLAFEIMRFASPPRYLADGMFSGATFTPDVAL